MKRISTLIKIPVAAWLLALLVFAVLTAGCETQPSGSREFIPGQGWVPTENQ